MLDNEVAVSILLFALITFGFHLSDLCQNIPLWIWDLEGYKQADITTKVYCWFNHHLRLPTKERIDRPIFSYDKLILDSLLILDFSNTLRHDFKTKRIWVKKSYLSGNYQILSEIDTHFCRNSWYYFTCCREGNHFRIRYRISWRAV